ncbi:protein kinase domain-containing protein [Kitasatospora sp. NPDC004531]
MELCPNDPTHIGPYALLARLGAGDLGQVYLGRSPGGRLAAIKVLTAEILEHPDVLARLRRDAETVRSVRGPYIAHLVDASLDADSPPLWLATEYVAGPTLAQAVADRGPLPSRTCLGLLAAMAEGLAAVHAHGVTHRDLKPQNVVLSAQGPQLVDFGLAHAPGTPAFTAPEVLAGGRNTPAADVFALGATVAHAATGRPPFGSGAATEIDRRVADLFGVEYELAELLDACLAPDPAARPGLREVVARSAVRTVLPEDPAYQAVAGWPLPYPTTVPVAEPSFRALWEKESWKAGTAVGVAASVLATFGILWAGGAFDEEPAGGPKGQGAGVPTAASQPTPGGPPPYVRLDGANGDAWSSREGACGHPGEEAVPGFRFGIGAGGDGRPAAGRPATVDLRLESAAGTGAPYYVSVALKAPTGAAGPPPVATSRPVAIGEQPVVLTYPDDFRSWAADGSSLPATGFADAPGDWTVLFLHVTDTTHYRSIACTGFRIA